jgi:putative transposase
VKYAFMRDHAQEFRVRTMCRVFTVHPSGFYAWLRSPQSSRARENQRLLGLIKHAYLESGCVYGYCKIHDDMRALGERCGKHRVERLMKLEGLGAQVGYGRRPRGIDGKPAQIAPNVLEQHFAVPAPNTHWVTDITYLKTYEGRLFLSVVLDLYSRQVVGWSMQPRM